MDYKTQIEEIQAAGLTQAAIGAAIGKSQVWVSDFLRGRYKDIKSAEAKSIGVLHSSMVSNIRSTGSTSQTTPETGSSDGCGHRAVEDRLDNLSQKAA